MRVRRSLWTAVALLAALGVAFLVRGEGQAGPQQSARGRNEAQEVAGPELKGLARSAQARPRPQDAPPAALVAHMGAGSVTDDGEVYSVTPEAGQVALTLRLTALGSGEALSIREWVVAGAVYPVPSGRVPRMPVVPGRWISVQLRESRRGDGSWRFLSERLAIEIPVPAPDALQVGIPTLEDLTHDPVWVVPVSRGSGVVLPGGTWEPPPRRSELRPIAADAHGRIAVPLAVLRSTIEEGVEPYAALQRGLMVPGHHPHAGVPALTSLQLRRLVGSGELPVPLWPRAGEVAHRLQLFEPDGSLASRVRVVLSERLLRLWTDADGVVTWQGPADRSSQVEVFTADGWPREVFELPAGAGLGDEPTRVVLPETAMVTLEFEMGDPASFAAGGLPRRLSLGSFGRLFLSQGDPLPPSPPQVPDRVDETGLSILDTELDPAMPRVRVRLPLRRELQLSTLVAPALPEMKGHHVLFDFVLDGSDRRLVFDWPPTRILSRHDR